jgi:hypothetical protein
MASVLGRRGVADWSTPDERPKDYMGEAFKLFPDVGQLCNALSKVTNGRTNTVTDPEYKCFEWRLPDMAFTVNGSQATADTVIEIDAPGSTPAKGLKAGDILIDETSKEQVLVEADPVSPYTSIVVRRHWGGTNAGSAIANDSILRWNGSAYGDGSRAPKAVSRNHVVVTNYIQTFKETANMPRIAEGMSTRPQKPWPQLKAEALERLKIKMEYAFLFGVAAEDSDADGNRLSTTAGITSLVTTNVFDYSSTGISLDDFEDAMASIFKYGSKEKLAVGGNGAMLILNRMFRKNNMGTWAMNQVQNKAGGMRLTEYAHPFGSLMFAPSTLMTQSTAWTSWLVVVDLDNVDMVKMPNGNIAFHDNAQETDRSSHKGYYEAMLGLRLGLEECHGVLKGLTTFRP